MSVRLHINVDHVATLRNQRGTPYPDPVAIAERCERAGADGITVHLREDRRHIQDGDVERLRATVVTTLNLECAPTAEMLAAIKRYKPDVVTLVPERREEQTTEGGLDVTSNRTPVEKVGALCHEAGIKLSLFIEASLEMVKLSREVGAQQVEFHTGEYCLAREKRRALLRAEIAEASRFAQEIGLEVAAGHGLTRHNLIDIVTIPQISELNIGHAVIADAIYTGIDQAVRDYRAAIDRGVRLRQRG